MALEDAPKPWPISLLADHAGPAVPLAPGDGLAVYVALNLEHYAFGEGMLDELVPLGPQPDVLNFSWLEWGNRVGAWRLLELFQSLDMPLTVLVNAAVYQGAPGLVEAFRAAGCEIAAHGRTNAERQGDLPAEGEAALIAEATGEIARQEGAPPRRLARPLDLGERADARSPEGGGIPLRARLVLRRPAHSACDARRPAPGRALSAGGQ